MPDSRPQDNTLHQGDHLGLQLPAVLPNWPDAFVDAVVCDPPYELWSGGKKGAGFMGKAWDGTGVAFHVGVWGDVLRVMKPGAHLLAFGGTRTYHRMVCAIEDAGFEIRDQLQWIYGTGFPKSLDIAKAMDKKAGHWRGRAGAVTRENQVAKGTEYERTEKGEPITATATATATAWDGWGTALKPANEPICLARKPLSEGTVAANVLRWGTGALNVDAGRIGDDVVGWGGGGGGNAWKEGTGLCKDGEPRPTVGRWPANVLFDQYAAGVLDGKSPDASRFFYVAKPDTGERNAGLEDEEPVTGGVATDRQDGSAGLASPRAGAGRTGGNQNFHPTVKPVDIMAYLIQLVTPPGGLVLDPYAGSGTTLLASVRLGHPYLGVELSAEYIEIARARLAAESAQGRLL